MRLAWVLVVALALASSARADVVVDVQGAEGASFAAALGMSEQELEAAIQSDLETLFNAANPGEYITQISNAQAFSSKGIGVDYASNVRRAVLGVAVNLSAAVDSATLEGDDRPVGGIAPNITIMGGVNLGAPAITIYGNFFTRSFSYRDFDATLRNAGVHVQISLFRRPQKQGKDKEADNESIIVRWGGLDITTGVEWAYLSLDLAQELTSETEVAGSGSNRADVIADLTGEYSLSSSSFSVPIEITTSLRFLYLASLYGGVGIDFQTGAADLEMNLAGTLTGRDQSGNTADLGTVSIVATEDGKPSTGRFRGLLGAQFNLGPVRIFGQLNYRPAAAIGVAAGLRVAW